MNSKLFVLFFVISIVCNPILAPADATQKTFLYFSYGSNMKTKRIHKNNPSAKPLTAAKLKDHQLDFIYYWPSWHGAISTIVPSAHSEVWGVAWEIAVSDMPYLDEQEGVGDGLYFAKNVTVRTPNDGVLECRTYQQTVLPDEWVQPSELPPERQPSLSYLNVMIEGAKEHNIPAYYLEFLQSFRDNNYRGPVSYE